MLEKIIPSILAVLLPFIVTFFSKKNKASLRKNLIEDAQRKVDFLDRFYEVSNKLLPETEIQSLKTQLSIELVEVKRKISSFDKEVYISDYHRLSGIQKIFLTFTPASVLGWLWTIFFYINLVFVVFLFWGLSLNEAGDFSTENFTKDYESIFIFGFFILPLLLFRWLAIKNYKSETNVHNPEPQVE